MSIKSALPKKAMMIKTLLVALGLGFVVLMAGVASVFKKGERVRQPIQFNHKLHTEDLQIPCTDCHIHVQNAEFAGCPEAQLCATCHETAVTKSPEEARLIKYIKSGEEIPWRRLYDVPSHVFYSHRRHVTVAKLECAVCHGEIGQSVAPPARPLRTLSMDFCIDCHEQRKVTTDCNACHR